VASYLGFRRGASERSRTNWGAAPRAFAECTLDRGSFFPPLVELNQEVSPPFGVDDGGRGWNFVEPGGTL
jgi:hypothetical protein